MRLSMPVAEFGLSGENDGFGGLSAEDGSIAVSGSGAGGESLTPCFLAESGGGDFADTLARALRPRSGVTSEVTAFHNSRSSLDDLRSAITRRRSLRPIAHQHDMEPTRPVRTQHQLLFDIGRTRWTGYEIDCAGQGSFSAQACKRLFVGTDDLVSIENNDVRCRQEVERRRKLRS